MRKTLIYGICAVFTLIILANSPLQAQTDRTVYIIPSAEKGLVSHVSALMTPENAAIEVANVRINKKYGSISSRDILVSEIVMGTGPINAIHRFYTSAGNSYTVSANSTLLRYDASGTATTLFSGLTDGKRWQFVTYKDLCIGGNGYNQSMKWDGLTLTTADTTGARTAGDLMAELGAPFCQLITGTTQTGAKWYQYTVVYYDGTTYRHTKDAATSLPCRSNPLLTGATVSSIKLTGIPIGPAGTTHRYICRSQANSSRANCITDTTYKMVKDIADNTTTWTDDVAVGAEPNSPTWAAMSAADTTHISVRPPLGYILEICNERLFVSGNTTAGYQSDIYWSENGKPDIFKATKFVQIRPDDGDKVTFLKMFLGILTAGKTNTIQKIYTSGEDVDSSGNVNWYVSNPFSFVGCPAPFSATVTPSGIFYLSRHGWYNFSGQASTLISDSVTKEIEDISQINIAESVGFYWNNECRLSYTSESAGGSTNNRVLVYDLIRNGFVVDTENVNCFAAFNSGNDYGTLYSGSSTTDGYIFAHSPTLYSLSKRYKSELDAGTFSKTSSSGTEENPILSMPSLDNMEAYTTNTLARASWISSETTASKKIPPDLGTGADGSKTVSADEILTGGIYNYTDLTVDAGKVLKVGKGTTIKCLGTVTINGTLYSGGTLNIYAHTVTVGAAGMIGGKLTIRVNTINNNGTITGDAAQAGTKSVSAINDNDYATSNTTNGATSIFISPSDIIAASAKVGAGSTGENQTSGASAYVESTIVASANSSNGVFYGNHNVTVSWSGNISDAAQVMGYTTSWNGGAVGFWYEIQAYMGTPTIDYINGSVGTIRSAPTTLAAASTTDYVYALDVYSEGAIKNQANYSIKMLVPPGADTLNENISKTITATNLSNYSTITGSIDPTASVNVTGVNTLFLTELIVGDSIRVNSETRVVATITSDTALTVTVAFTDTANDAALQKVNYSTILVDVYALRSGITFQMGIGEAALTDLVDIDVTTANTWQTVSITGLTDADVDAATTIGFKFTNTDSGNIVYIDNIRPAATSAFWLSPIYDISAVSLKKLYWNENLNTYGDVTWVIRTSDTAALTGATWTATEYTNPNGSVITDTAYRYIQFRAKLTTTDTTTYLYPWLYQTDGYLFKINYSKIGSNYETSVSNVWKTGWRNFGNSNKKMIKRITVDYEGESENLLLNIKGDDPNVDQTFTIDMSVLPDNDLYDRYIGTPTNKRYIWEPPVNSPTEQSLISELFQFTITHEGDEPFKVDSAKAVVSDQEIY